MDEGSKEDPLDKSPSYRETSTRNLGKEGQNKKKGYFYAHSNKKSLGTYKAKSTQLKRK